MAVLVEFNNKKYEVSGILSNSFYKNVPYVKLGCVELELATLLNNLRNGKCYLLTSKAMYLIKEYKKNEIVSFKLEKQMDGGFSSKGRFYLMNYDNVKYYIEKYDSNIA